MASAPRGLLLTRPAPPLHAPSSSLRASGFHSYQEAIRLYETEEAYQGLPFTNDVLATLNYHTSVSRQFGIDSTGVKYGYSNKFEIILFGCLNFALQYSRPTPEYHEMTTIWGERYLCLFLLAVPDRPRARLDPCWRLNVDA